jgi:hypothetical protein
MKLTTEQNMLKIISFRRTLNGILQVELTDHMVKYGGFWEKKSDWLSGQTAENIFIGDSSFKSIEKQRKRFAKKRKVQWKMITDYLKFPKILEAFY